MWDRKATEILDEVYIDPRYTHEELLPYATQAVAEALCFREVYSLPGVLLATVPNPDRVHSPELSWYREAAAVQGAVIHSSNGEDRKGNPVANIILFQDRFNFAGVQMALRNSPRDRRFDAVHKLETARSGDRRGRTTD